ncbi:MAG: sulfatase-like hydrolase/transferase, partial [Opitutales bacterium]|nr:sulfatase-like hydrolase/transferase [Opitutales bacterium]
DDRVGEVLEALDRNGFSDNTRVIYTSDHGESLGQRGLYGKFTMLEDSAAIPLIISGPEIPSNQVIKAPVSLVDFHPTLIEMVTGENSSQESRVDGKSINPLFTSEASERSVISEYHAVASNNAWYMVRKGTYKLIYYVGNDSPIQLYDIDNDPMEERDLANDPASANTRAMMEAELRSYLDPEETNKRAKADQAKLIASYGGREAVLGQGTFINSPVPGENATFVTEDS